MIGAALGDLAVLAHFAVPSRIPFNLHLWPVRYRPFRFVSFFLRPDAFLELAAAPPQALSHTASLYKSCFSASLWVAGRSDVLPRLTFRPSTTTTITTLGSSIYLMPALGIISALTCNPGLKRKGTPVDCSNQPESNEFNGSMQQQAMQPQLHPLTAPQWPSMLNSRAHPGLQLITPQPQQPIQPVSIKQLRTPKSARSARSTPIPRMFLTDNDRKRMCQYAEDHPNAKQTEIGAIFGVERR